MIYERANAEKINMRLTTWKKAPDEMIYKYDASIAKNYLNENEKYKVKQDEQYISSIDKMYKKYLEENKS